MLTTLAIATSLNAYSSGLTKLVRTIGVALHQTTQVIVTRLDVCSLNTIQEFLIWRMLVTTFTTHARIFAIYLNLKRCVLLLFCFKLVLIQYQVIGQLRDVLAFMSLSSYTLAYFDEAREDLHIGRGLISIGETRFGSIYWSLNSVLDGMPAFRKIMQESSLGIESEVWVLIF